jgi:hypothetical protein
LLHRYLLLTILLLSLTSTFAQEWKKYSTEVLSVDIPSSIIELDTLKQHIVGGLTRNGCVGVQEMQLKPKQFAPIHTPGDLKYAYERMIPATMKPLGGVLQEKKLIKIKGLLVQTYLFKQGEGRPFEKARCFLVLVNNALYFLSFQYSDHQASKDERKRFFSSINFAKGLSFQNQKFPR